MTLPFLVWVKWWNGGLKPSKGEKCQYNIYWPTGNIFHSTKKFPLSLNLVPQILNIMALVFLLLNTWHYVRTMWPINPTWQPCTIYYWCSKISNFSICLLHLSNAVQGMEKETGILHWPTLQEIIGQVRVAYCVALFPH
jgi:hypothetical protein